MARPNVTFGGFQYYGSAVSQNIVPNVIERQVATGYATAIFAGDPVKKVSDGTVAISAAGSDPIFGIVAWVRYRNADGNLVDRDYVPASTAYSVDKLRTIVGVIVCYPGVWFKVTANATIADIATARTYVDENVDHVATATGDTLTGRGGYQIAIGGHATSAKQWRLVAPMPDPSNDPTQINGAWIVECNNTHNLPGVFSTTGI